MNCVFGERLDIFGEKEKFHLLQSYIVHFDESGIHVNRARQWLHTMSIKGINFQVVHYKAWKRGDERNGCAIPLFRNRYSGWMGFLFWI